MSGTILVVDDSPTELKIVAEQLQTSGYTVVTATRGEEALSMATAEHPALIILDVMMPGKSGYQVCRILKTNPATRTIKVLILTSRTGESDRFWGMKQGADGYLTKPFNSEDLLHAVTRLVG